MSDQENKTNKDPEEEIQESPEELFQKQIEKSIEKVVKIAVQKPLEGNPSPPKRKVVDQAINQATNQLTKNIALFSGPYPPPSFLKAYEEVSPGFSEHLIAEMEKETQHRRDMDTKTIDLEKLALKTDHSTQRLGSVFAFLIAMTFVFCGTYAAMNGYEKYGSIIAGGSLAGIVTAFIVGKAFKG